MWSSSRQDCTARTGKEQCAVLTHPCWGTLPLPHLRSRREAQSMSSSGNQEAGFCFLLCAKQTDPFTQASRGINPQGELDLGKSQLQQKLGPFPRILIVLSRPIISYDTLGHQLHQFSFFKIFPFFLREEYKQMEQGNVASSKLEALGAGAQIHFPARMPVQDSWHLAGVV